jgi:hypothetical protein
VGSHVVVQVGVVMAAASEQCCGPAHMQALEAARSCTCMFGKPQGLLSAQAPLARAFRECLRVCLHLNPMELFDVVLLSTLMHLPKLTDWSSSVRLTASDAVSGAHRSAFLQLLWVHGCAGTALSRVLVTPLLAGLLTRVWPCFRPFICIRTLAGQPN